MKYIFCSAVIVFSSLGIIKAEAVLAPCADTCTYRCPCSLICFVPSDPTTIITCGEYGVCQGPLPVSTLTVQSDDGHIESKTEWTGVRPTNEGTPNLTKSGSDADADPTPSNLPLTALDLLMPDAEAKIWLPHPTTCFPQRGCSVDSDCGDGWCVVGQDPWGNPQRKCLCPT